MRSPGSPAGGGEFSYSVVKKGEDDLGIIFDSFTWEVLQIRPESVVDQQNQRLAAEPLVASHQLQAGDRLLNVNGKQDRLGIRDELFSPSRGRQVFMKVVRTEDTKLASASPSHPAAPSTIGVPAASQPPPQEEAAAHAVAAAPTPAATASAAAAEDTDTPPAAASPPAKAAGAEAAAQAFDEADPADAQPPPDAPDADAALSPPGAGAQAEQIGDPQGNCEDRPDIVTQAGRTWHRYMHEVSAKDVMYWWWCETDDFAFKETDSTWSLKPDPQVGQDVWSNGVRSFIEATGVELP